MYISAVPAPYFLILSFLKFQLPVREIKIKDNPIKSKSGRSNKVTGGTVIMLCMRMKVPVGLLVLSFGHDLTDFILDRMKIKT